MRILLVDDEKIVLDGMNAIIQQFQKTDWEVMGNCQSAEEAMEMMEQNVPEVVITDIRMNEVSGIDLATWIREKHPQVLVILLTGYADFNFAQTAVKLGVFDYLLKPTRYQNILESLSKAHQVLLEKNQAVQTLLQKESQWELSKPAVREKFFRDFMYGILPVEKSDLLLEEGSWQHQHFTVLYAQLHAQLPTNSDQGERSMAVGQDVFEKFKEYWYGKYLDPVIFLENNTTYLAILFTSTHQDEDICIQQCQILIQDIAASTEQKVMIGVGNCYLGLDSLLTSCHEAQRCLHECTQRNLPVIGFSMCIGKPENKNYSASVKRGLEYIEKNYQNAILLKDVSDHVFLNPWYFSELFKKEVGQNFSHYIIQKRLEKAKRLLISSDLKLYEIAQEVGFNENSYFSQLFKKEIGISPKEYRAQNGIL